ncbi:MAG: UDP-N-acetylmuramate--L-alanine ligase [Bacteroidales bacterium]
MSVKKVYLIGIGGIGMSALARYYNHAGCIVAGYDRTESKLTQELIEEGMEIHYDDKVSNIPERFKESVADTLVIYTPAVPADSEELEYFRNLGYEVIKRSRALGHIAAGKKTFAVAGTHGKTTTSTLLSHIMESSGKGCTAFLGGISKNYHTNLLLSKNDILVAEADEFDRSFLQLWPHVGVITSVDPDHLDIYDNRNSFREAFGEFASQINSNGFLVVKDEIDNSVLKDVKAKIYRYSYKNRCDFFASDIAIYDGGFFRFNLNYPGGVIEGCTVGIPGWVNVENGIAASAAALLGGVAPEKVKQALESFKGVERRFDIRIKSDKCSYIDDYAHHPKEISAAISSIRNIFPDKKLTGIFQPHLYTRTRDFANEFAESLSALDSLILLDIYPARELPIPGVSSQIIFDKVTIADKRLITKDLLMDELSKREIETLITFGAGDIDRFVEPLTTYIQKRYNV